MRIRLTRNLFIILAMDIALLFCSIYFAHLIRFDFTIPKPIWAQFLPILFSLIGLKILCFSFFDLYKGMWRYTSLNDILNIVKASTVSSVIIIVVVLYFNRFENVSRSVFVIDWCLTVFFIIGLRVFTRLCFSKFTEDVSLKMFKEVLFSIFRIRQKQGRGVLIIGAGDCGEMICREFRENASVKSYIAGFLDDDESKVGRKIHGIPVIGEIEDLDRIVDYTGVEEAIIAIPSMRRERLRQVISLCKKVDINFKIVPNMGELIDGKISISSIRKVEYRDLLGRKPVQLDKIEIGRYLGRKTVMVTGAAGSIGSGLCRQICRYSPDRLLLFERAESPLYDLDLELKKSFPGIDIMPILGDVQNRDELNKIFGFYPPEIVFHAAAYKHVPMLENYPWKAVENNVLGTKNMVETSDHYGCEKFVFVSTDKAVNPCNIMGTSKRIAEMIVQNQNIIRNSKTKFMTVRFGNVIGSVGSVIPLFKKQIAEGGPVTVTHPEVIRFFMLIPEACQLILQAGALGAGGEIFILEMGKPVKIADMAKDLIRFSGFEPDVEIKIEYIGLRPGEKLYEELMTDHEDVVSTGHEKIMVLKSEEIDIGRLNGKLDALKIESQNRNTEGIKTLFKKMVPEYKPS